MKRFLLRAGYASSAKRIAEELDLKDEEWEFDQDSRAIINFGTSNVYVYELVDKEYRVSNSRNRTE